MQAIPRQGHMLVVRHHISGLAEFYCWFDDFLPWQVSEAVVGRFIAAQFAGNGDGKGSVFGRLIVVLVHLLVGVERSLFASV